MSSIEKPRFIELDGVQYIGVHAIASSNIRRECGITIGAAPGLRWSVVGEVLSVTGGEIIRVSARAQEPGQITYNMAIDIDDSQLKQVIADLERVSVKSIDDLASEVYPGLSAIAGTPEERWREAYRIAHIRASLRVNGGAQ